MPRKKKAASKGKNNRQGQRFHQRSSDETLRTPDVGSSSRQVTHAFTLQDEARNTERHHGFWSFDQKLRHSTVNFVSAGNLDPAIPVERPREVDVTASSLADLVLASASDEIVISTPKNAYHDHDPPSLAGFEGIPSNHEPFYVDVQPDPVSTGIPSPRVSSPTPSNSSTEVILFGGRDEYGRAMSRQRQGTRTISDPVEERIEEVERELEAKSELLEEVLRKKHESLQVQVGEHSGTQLQIEVEIDSTLPVRRYRASRSRKHRSVPAEQAEEEALLADYIAGMNDSHGFLENFGNRQLGSGEEDIWQDETDQMSDELGQIREHKTNRSAFVDLDDLSTSDAPIGDVVDVLSKRERKSGVQYLVLWENQSVDEARWVPVAALTNANALLQIEKFEAEESLVAEFLENSRCTDDSDLLDEDEDVESDSKSQTPFIPLHRMTDEQIARLLAKQEEFGMGASERIFFDDDGEDEQDITFADAGLHASQRSHDQALKTRGKKASGAHHRKGEFPPAHVLADAYDGFDVMDFDRPSLRRKAHGRKGKLAFDLSDSELEMSMLNTWEKDRIRKKERKQEREALRTQGLLGSKNGKSTLSVKYMEGMALHQIKEEFKQFLNSDHTTLALPPMEKASRKAVHDLANAFNLKSKSAGAGKQRFPVLYKTQNVRPYLDHTFDAIATRLSRRFLPRPDVRNRKVGSSHNRSTGMSAVSYRDGDIVGASAPELGVENRGRAMLEKMGWSSGTALGALNNKGILQPVSHVVKTSKAGLG